MSEIEIGGITYTLTDAPLRKDVLRVRRMKKAQVYDMLDLSAFQGIGEKGRGNIEISKLLQEQILDDPAKLATFTDMDEETGVLSTIMLVTGLDADEIGKMPFKDSETLYEKCVEVLGGDMSAFFPDSNMSTSSSASEAVTMTEKVERDYDTSTPENPPENSSEESKTGQEDIPQTTSD